MGAVPAGWHIQDKGWTTEVTEDVVALKMPTGDERTSITVYHEADSWAIATPDGVSRVPDGDLESIVDAVDRVATDIG